MDFFESIARRILEDAGYWTRVSVRAELTKKQKKQLGKPSLPRPEVDILAYKPKTKELIFFEVKSFLDSTGVIPSALHPTTIWKPNRYKLLTLRKYQRLVVATIIQRFQRDGLIAGRPKVRFGLIAGKVKGNREDEVAAIAKLYRWEFIGPCGLQAKIAALAETDYENCPIVMTSKILGRVGRGPKQ